MFNVISAAEEIVAWYDLTTILTTMVACTSTFAAIIGGLIANKAISDTAEKESIDRQLQQIDAELKVNEKELDGLYEWIDQYNAKDFIRNNLDALLAKTPLSDVYDASDGNEIEYDTLLPYWDKALIAVKKFNAAASAEKNNDDVPKTIVDELDAFQYAICSEHHNCLEKGFISAFDTTISLDTQKYRIQYYNENSDKISELEKVCEILDAKKALLQERHEAVSVGKDIISGMKIFSVVSAFNIILPLFFLLYNPTTNKIWYYAETIISFVTFILGMSVMVHYIFSLFPKKSESAETKGVEQEHE